MEGLGVEELETVLGGLVRLELARVRLGGVWMLRFYSLGMETLPVLAPRGCGVLYAVARDGGRYRLGIGIVGGGEGFARSLARALGARDVDRLEGVDGEALAEYLRTCPEVPPQLAAQVLEPSRSPRLCTPLSTELAPVGSDGIRVGRILDPVLRERGDAYLPSEVGHVLIVGATGSGKSTTLRRLCIEVSRLRPVVVLDWVGEHGEALGSVARVVRLGIDASIRLRARDEDDEQFVDRLAYYVEVAWGHTLTPLQRRILATVVSRVEDPTIDRLLATLSRWLSSDRRDYVQSADALVSRLSALKPLRNAFDPSKPPVEPPTRGILVIDISRVEPARLRKIAAHALLHQLLREARRARKSLAVAIDEAHNILDTDARNIVVEAYLEYRKFGIEMILATSDFTEIPRQLLQNTSTMIVHRVPSLRQAEALADLFGTSRSERDAWIETLRTLPTGVAAVITRESPYPALVAVEPA